MQWGLFNLSLLSHHNAEKNEAAARSRVAPAVVGFFRSVALGQADGGSPPPPPLFYTLKHAPLVHSANLLCSAHLEACLFPCNGRVPAGLSPATSACVALATRVAQLRGHCDPHGGVGGRGSEGGAGGGGAGGAGAGENLQDILRILTLWFNHGAEADVEAALQDGFSRVSIDTWLVVIPQAHPPPLPPLPPTFFPPELPCPPASHAGGRVSLEHAVMLRIRIGQG